MSETLTIVPMLRRGNASGDASASRSLAAGAAGATLPRWSVGAINVLYRDESFWLTQKRMAELFGVQRPAITKHLKNIYETGELAENSVCSILEHTAADGKTYRTQNYNLDAIIAVGYRVNSRQATQFRIWATQTLKEFIIKGFVLDDERLKQGQRFGQDYFDELLVPIREIRASKRRFYHKIYRSHAPAWECSHGRSSVPSTGRWSGWGFTPMLERGSEKNWWKRAGKQLKRGVVMVKQRQKGEALDAQMQEKLGFEV